MKFSSPDGSLWYPGKHSRICNVHFIGQHKSEDPSHPAYYPTIFQEYEAIIEKPSEQFLQLQESSENVETFFPSTNELMDSISSNVLVDKEIQTDIVKSGNCETSINNSLNTVFLVCNRFVDSNAGLNHIEVQTEINIVEEIQVASEIKMRNSSTQTHNEILAVNKKCQSGFHGYESLETSDDQALLDLCGVSRESFQLLLKVYLSKSENINTKKITPSDKLLIFAMKMKLNLTYSALSALFRIHRTTVSNIFVSVLLDLNSGCQEFVRWPSREVIEYTLPPEFKKDYFKCRVIIDCTEFRTEQPAGIGNRVHFYSHYKKGFRIKILVGCTPGGLISFVSQCFGGKTTDAQITIQSGFIQKLEPGDLVLADKGFPEIKSLIDGTGKGSFLGMPPFLEKDHFTAEEVERTRSIAAVRIHIERIMQRLRIYKILDYFTHDSLPYCDEIVFMCCVLVNLQPPIIKKHEL